MIAFLIAAPVALPVRVDDFPQDSGRREAMHPAAHQAAA